MMEEKRVFYPPKELSEKAYIKSLNEYKKLYQKSVDEPEGFWGEMAEQLDWLQKGDRIMVDDFKNARHERFIGGKINISYNCLDRHIPSVVRILVEERQ